MTQESEGFFSELQSRIFKVAIIICIIQSTLFVHSVVINTYIIPKMNFMKNEWLFGGNIILRHAMLSNTWTGVWRGA